MASINVFLAYILGNRRGKQVDVYGRTYKEVYRRFGNKAMTRDYLHGNSWYVKKRI